ncbi:MAG: asparagine synthase C-terminal domain-containing protein [Bacteroides sp.]|jgi:asparagine synthase (glutamine-hydrolysing)|nr:asparagine synthase C-terminal domain-containing protein [Bacteroides sp.]
MNQLFLVYNYNYYWHQAEDLYFKGFFFDRDGRHYHEGGALEVLAPLKDRKAIRQEVESIDGPFTIIKQTSEGILICTGAMSIFPVFYTWENGKWLVSDSSDQLLNMKQDKHCNTDAFDEFMGAGFVMGRETLLKGIYKSQAAEILLLKPDGTTASDIYNYFLPKAFWGESLTELKVKLVYKLKNVTKRLITSLKDRTVVVPLSGGYDSRLIVSLLKNAGYEKVICFTYGRPNQESELSQQVAEKLGYQWIFVDYRKTDIKGYLHDPVFQDYNRYAGNNYTMPYLQEYFAVKYLKDNKLIPDDSVFLPGHGGDFLAGGHVKKAARTKRDLKNLAPHIAKKYFLFIPLGNAAKDQITRRLEQWFEGYHPPDGATDPFYSVYAEDWYVKERGSKFIFQSAQVFPYFGYAFRLPLWHKDLRNLFRQVPFDLRLNQQLYYQLLEDEFFKPLGIFFEENEMKEVGKNSLEKRIRKILKPLVPGMVLARKLKAADWMCYDKFTSEMEQQLKKEGHPPLKTIFSYNARICRWYLQQVRKKTDCRN